MTLPWSMTATAMPLAFVCCIILFTSPSMVAALGIDCATAAAGTQNTADIRTESERVLFHILIGFPFWNCIETSHRFEGGGLDGLGSGTHRSWKKFELRQNQPEFGP